MQGLGAHATYGLIAFALIPHATSLILPCWERTAAPEMETPLRFLPPVPHGMSGVIMRRAERGRLPCGDIELFRHHQPPPGRAIDGRDESGFWAGGSRPAVPDMSSIKDMRRAEFVLTQRSLAADCSAYADGDPARSARGAYR